MYSNPYYKTRVVPQRIADILKHPTCSEKAKEFYVGLTSGSVVKIRCCDLLYTEHIPDNTFAISIGDYDYKNIHISKIHNYNTIYWHGAKFTVDLTQYEDVILSRLDNKHGWASRFMPITSFYKLSSLFIDPTDMSLETIHYAMTTFPDKINWKQAAVYMSMDFILANPQYPFVEEGFRWNRTFTVDELLKRGLEPCNYTSVYRDAIEKFSLETQVSLINGDFVGAI